MKHFVSSGLRTADPRFYWHVEGEADGSGVRLYVSGGCGEKKLVASVEGPNFYLYGGRLKGFGFGVQILAPAEED